MRALALFLALIAAALVALAAFTWPVWVLLQPYFGLPFHRVGDRIALLTLAAGVVICARRLGVADRVSLGYGLARGDFLRELLIALGLGAASMAAGVGLMAMLGLLAARAPGPGVGAPHALAVLGLACKALASGLAVAFLEETFARGALLTAVRRESGSVVAVAASALIYSASHFIAAHHIAAATAGPWSGLEMLAGSFAAFAHPLGIADSFLCLTAVGIVLGVVRLRTGNIAACIGLHAGWVWVMLVTHGLAQPDPDAPRAWLLSAHDGFTGWLLLGWLLPLGLALDAFHARRARRAAQAAGQAGSAASAAASSHTTSVRTLPSARSSSVR